MRNPRKFPGKERNYWLPGAKSISVICSAIGRALAPNDPFARIAISTVAGSIGAKFAQVFSASLTLDASKIDVSAMLAQGPVDLRGAAAGAVASFLVAELGEQLHLDHFSQQLFAAAGGGFAGSLAQQVARDGLGVLSGAAWGKALDASGISVGSTLGSILANQIHPAETQAGAIGGQLLGAVGSLAAATAIGEAAGLALDIIVPGIGSLIGTLLGTMIGDAFGHGVPHPTSVDIIQPASYSYGHSQWAADDGGDASLSAALSGAVTEIVNADLKALDGIGLASSLQHIMIGYQTGYPAEPYVTGWFPNGGEAAHFSMPPSASSTGASPPPRPATTSRAPSGLSLRINSCRRRRTAARSAGNCSARSAARSVLTLCCRGGAGDRGMHRGFPCQHSLYSNKLPAIRAEIHLRALGNTARNPRKFLGMEHNYWLPWAKNALKGSPKIKNAGLAGSAGGGKRDEVGISANGQLWTAYNCAPASAALWADDEVKRIDADDRVSRRVNGGNV